MKKLKNYLLSLNIWKKILLVFFVSTFDIWFFAILGFLLGISGLSELEVFRAGYATFLGNRPLDLFASPTLITDFGYYYIYLYPMGLDGSFFMFFSYFNLLGFGLSIFYFKNSPLNKFMKIPLTILAGIFILKYFSYFIVFGGLILTMGGGYLGVLINQLLIYIFNLIF